VLARELTFEEVHDITAAAGIETEVFIHGALCCSYSGLCLFSSQTLGRSGNRGKCAYSCRDSYEVKGAPMALRDGSPVKRDPSTGFPFSMKDLALPDHLPALRAAGVSCFKIEGRKKGPLYVAMATDYYRRLMAGTLDEAERAEREADLPALTPKWEEQGLRHKIGRLRDAGWTRWQAANLSAWMYLGLDPAADATAGIDLATDWSVYVLNRLAARQLVDMGVSRFALSPEDGLANLRPLLAEFGTRAVLIVYQDTPLFLAESCAYANLIGGCPGKARCSFESMEMVSSHGEKVTALDYHCRTIVLNQGPFCLAPRLPKLADAGATALRADFIYRKYEPEMVRDRWRAVRAGRAEPGGHAANFDRGVL
jgi:collagenase-like PrtC family protease